MTSGTDNYYCHLDEEDAVDKLNAALAPQAVMKDPASPDCSDAVKGCSECRGKYDTCCTDMNCKGSLTCQEGKSIIEVTNITLTKESCRGNNAPARKNRILVLRGSKSYIHSLLKSLSMTLFFLTL